MKSAALEFVWKRS